MHGRKGPPEILFLMVLVALAYVAFRVGAVLMKVLLGLISIGFVFWLEVRLIRALGVEAAASTALAA